MRILNICLLLTLGFWIAVLLMIINGSKPPILLLGGDEVTPKLVRSGDRITVTRNFRILREENLTVTRTMILGNCALRCEIVDLPSSSLFLAPGDYLKLSRDHVIPSAAHPGKWRLAFSVIWRDHIRREHKIELEPLYIEVVY